MGYLEPFEITPEFASRFVAGDRWCSAMQEFPQGPNLSVHLRLRPA